MKALRALLAFLALPGLVAGLLPVVIAHGSAQPPSAVAAGLVPLGLGALLLIWCVRDFFVAGRGTLAPWDPPTRLVVVGLYRFVRNPMYLAVLTIIAGWSIFYQSWWLAVYHAALAVSFHLRVVYYEEPQLRKNFGADWDAYAASVARWWPTTPPVK